MFKFCKKHIVDFLLVNEEAPGLSFGDKIESSPLFQK